MIMNTKQQRLIEQAYKYKDDASVMHLIVMIEGARMYALTMSAQVSNLSLEVHTNLQEGGDTPTQVHSISIAAENLNNQIGAIHALCVALAQVLRSHGEDVDYP